jgi:CheY-like chemotaxis protein
MPDLILLDIGLPDLDGYEVVRRLKSKAATRHIHVVALTGYGQASDVAQAAEAGFDDHLVKPAMPGKVLSILDKLRGRVSIN